MASSSDPHLRGESPSGIRKAVLAKLLQRIIRESSRNGQPPSLTTFVFQLMGGGQRLFQGALLEATSKEGWDSSAPLLRALCLHKKLASWIPIVLLPPMAIIDVEFSPSDGRVLEIACGTTHGLLDPPTVRELKSSKGLSPPDITRFLAECVPTGAWLVGHNLKEFDLPRLAVLGISLPAHRTVLDSIELSLLLRPLRENHRLDGEHNAAADVRRTYELLVELDGLVRQLGAEELAVWASSCGAGEGLGEFARWTSLRRFLRVHQGPNVPISRLLRTPPDRAGQDLASIRKALRSLPDARPASTWAAVQPGYVVEMNGDPSIDELTSAFRDALSRGGRLVASRQSIGRLRRWVRSKTGSLLATGTTIWQERVASYGRIESALDHLDPRAALFMVRWWEAGGRRQCEMHRIAQSWLGAALDEVFEPELDNAQPGVAVDLGSLAALPQIDGGETLVLDADQWAQAALDARGNRLELSAIGVSLATAAERVVANRVIDLVRRTRVRHILSLDKHDANAADVRELAARCEALGHRTGQKLSLALVSQVFARGERRMLELWEADGRIDRLRLTVRPCATIQATPKLGDLKRIGGVLCGPLGSVSCAARVERETGLAVCRFAERRPALALRACEDAGSGTLQGLGRSAHAAAARVMKAESPRSALLGFGGEIEPVLVAALRAAGVRAFGESLFGVRAATSRRITAQESGVFVGSSAPEPLPEFADEVYLRRLPFPSRDDPELQPLLDAANESQDLFEDVVLPQMLLRLRRALAEIRDVGRKVVLLDSRAVTHARIRNCIESTLGPIKLEPRGLKASDERLQRFDKALHDGLQRIGLRPGRDVCRDVDPMPVLRRIYGPNAQWRDHQKEIVRQALRGEDLLAVMPTGGGKSACFQIPALIMAEAFDGLTVVISPLLALMRDQVQGLKSRGIFGVETYNSDLAEKERLQVLRDVRAGWTALLYIAPEQLLSPLVRDALCERGISLLVVDEAHCLSEWGHDFRPEYRKIVEVLEAIARERGEPRRPQVLAFTATASRAISRDIREILSIETPPLDLGVRQENLYPRIQRLPDDCTLEDRVRELGEFIGAQGGAPGVVYATRRSDTERVSEALKALQLRGYPPSTIIFLHAGVDNRQELEKEFLRADSRLRIVVATTAFGMGVDKPDLAWVAHYDAPGSIEAYVQEIGRAGRDRRIVANALALAAAPDLRMRRRMASPLDEAEVALTLDRLRSGQRDRVRQFADPELLSAAAGVHRDRVAPAIFALERCGILGVKSRGAGVFVVRRGGAMANDDLATQRILACVSESDQTELRVETLAAGPLSDLDLPLEEVDRLVRRMVHAGLLARVAGVQYRRTPNPHWEAASSRFLRGEHEFARWLDARTQAGVHRWVRLTPGDQGEVQRISGLTLVELDLVLTEWRQAGLLDMNGGLLEVSVKLRDPAQFVEQVIARLGARRQMGRTLIDPILLKGQTASMGERAALGELVSRGLATEEQQSPTAASYLIEWAAEPREDAERLATLGLGARRQSAMRRQDALADLFAKDRSPQAIWSLIEEHFASEATRLCKPEVSLAIRESLNAQQLEAVEASPDHALLVNAAAGAGKTHMLARRVLRLQAEEGIEPSRILVLSFSRAGARAIGERVRALASDHGLHPVSCRTFHSLCFQLLHMLGLARSLISDVHLPRELRTGNRYFDNVRVNPILSDLFGHSLRGRWPAIGGRQNSEPAAVIQSASKMLDAVRSGHPDLDFVVIRSSDLRHDGIPKVLDLPDDEGQVDTTLVADVLEQYERELDRRDSIDFAGMVVLALDYIRREGPIRWLLRSRLDHLLVDEFQDTSRAQENLLRELIGRGTGMTVVGDNDQTIYSFNGSDVRNILEFSSRNETFRRDWQTQIVPMEENFRSTPAILEVAAAVIKKNQLRLDKTIRPASRPPTDARSRFRDSNVPVELLEVDSLKDSVQVASDLIDAWLKEGILPSEIAVLARMNPHGNPQRAVLDQLEQGLREQGVPIADAGNGQRVSAAERQALLALAAREPDLSPEEGIELSQSEGSRSTGVVALLRDARSRGLRTVHEVVDDLRAMEFAKDGGLASCEGGVVLKTIHAAKGEEFRRVIVLHLAGKLFPPARRGRPRPMAAPGGQEIDEWLEEERRLLYVAITRGEELVALTGERGNVFFEELAALGAGGMTSLRRSKPYVKPGRMHDGEPDDEGGDLGPPLGGSPPCDGDDNDRPTGAGDPQLGAEALGNAIRLDQTRLGELFRRMSPPPNQGPPEH